MSSVPSEVVPAQMHKTDMIRLNKELTSSTSVLEDRNILGISLGDICFLSWFSCVFERSVNE